MKCIKCKSNNVELKDVPNNGTGKIQKVICLDCGFDKGPKIFTSKNKCNDCPNPRNDETCGKCN